MEILKKNSAVCEKKQIKAVLMDMDGVLFDTESFSIELIIRTVAEQGLVMERDFIISNMGLGPNDILRVYAEHLGEKFDPALYWSRYWEERNAYYAKCGAPLKPGAIALLKWCKEHGVSCILTTSSPRHEAQLSLERAGVDMYFEGVVGGDMFEHSKPEPDIYLTAAREAGAQVEECIVLEDSLNGLISGRASGALTVMIPDIVPYSERHEPYTDHVYKMLDEVIELLS